MKHPLCPLCGQRKVRRACPALRRDICAVCCGTKRLVEIRCPATCVYLASSRAHPPAVAQRRQARDLRFLAAAFHGLTEPQHRLFFFLQAVIERYRGSALPAITDADVVESTAALASTIETAARGIIYEHTPGSLPAQRLAADLKAALQQKGATLGGALERDAALVLRRMEKAARDAGAALVDGETAYLDLGARVLRDSAAAPDGDEPAARLAGASGLIIP